MTDPSPIAPGRSRLSGVAERIALLGVSLVLLVALELGLRIAGVGAEDYAALDFGTVPHQHLYGPDPGRDGWITVAPWIRHMRERNVRKLINRSWFPARREPGELRIFACGESTVFGYPANAKIAFPLRLEEMLQQQLPDVPVRVINAGIPAHDSGRVRNVVEEILRYEPQVLIIYSGHNELIRRFAMERLEALGGRIRLRQRLARLRTYQILTWALGPLLRHEIPLAADMTSETKELDDREIMQRPRTAAEDTLVIERFRRNLRGCVEAARRSGVSRVILCTVASRLQSATNRKDVLVPPEKAALAPILAALAEAETGEDSERIARTGLVLSPRYAPLHHALGLALEAQGRLPEALHAYLAARELETNARRGGKAINEAIREVGRSAGATVVDVEALFLSRSDRGCFGDQLFWDHCHPDPEGHVVIAQALADAIPWAQIPRRRSE